MNALPELTSCPPGSRFAMWTVVRRDGQKHVIAKCECGETKRIQANHIMSGASKSCGCRMREKSFRHGMCNHPEYHAWANMIQRCENPKKPEFKNYGGRGISVCARWHVFTNFISDMGRRPPMTSIERIDNAGNYEPGNCKWATRGEQNRNHRRNKFIDIDGLSLTVTDWSKRLGMSRSGVMHRLKHWPLEKVKESFRMALSREEETEQ